MSLKNIFSKQLPNMPKEYITRLVFDRRHRSVAVVKQGGQVVGGITYRPFHAQANPNAIALMHFELQDLELVFVRRFVWV